MKSLTEVLLWLQHVICANSSALPSVQLLVYGRHACWLSCCDPHVKTREMDVAGIAANAIT